MSPSRIADVLVPVAVDTAYSYALPDGVTQPQLLRLLRMITAEFEVLSASVASYDPEVDETGRVGAAGLDVIELLATG